MARSRRLQFTGDLLLVLVVVAALVVASWLLILVAAQADSINEHARSIAKNTRGINSDTNAVRQLDRTNALAASILQSAKPLSGELGTTVNRANQIESDATSINDSAISLTSSAESITSSASGIEESATSVLGAARGINDTAGAIESTSGNINTEAASILHTAGLINTDVKRININLNRTITLIERIRSDTRQLVAAGLITHKEAACIDRQVNILKQPYNGGEFCEYEPESDRDD